MQRRRGRGRAGSGQGSGHRGRAARATRRTGLRRSPAPGTPGTRTGCAARCRACATGVPHTRQGSPVRSVDVGLARAHGADDPHVAPAAGRARAAASRSCRAGRRRGAGRPGRPTARPSCSRVELRGRAAAGRGRAGTAPRPGRRCRRPAITDWSISSVASGARGSGRSAAQARSGSASRAQRVGAEPGVDRVDLGVGDQRRRRWARAGRRSGSRRPCASGPARAARRRGSAASPNLP